MSDILIKGMEMPNENEILVFDTWNGKMYARCTANTGNKRYEVVPLPEKHGRLIDADNLLKAVHESRAKNPHMDGKIKSNHDSEHLHFLGMIYDAPTIIPAEGGTE